MATLTSGGTNRRSFLRRSATGTGGGRFALAAVEGLAARAALAEDGGRDRACPGNGGYGELRELTRTDPESGFSQTLRLPEEFDFAVFSVAGSPMRDGARTPLAHDGMACFPTGRRGEWRLVRNHEERSKPGAGVPAGSPGRRYDALGAGGTTTLKVRWQDGGPRFEEAWRSLSGTIVNRAGGPTPWGSWLSCEETTAGARAGWEAGHGYVFEVPSAEEGEADPVPLKAMGRFAHEAVAVDPRSGAVYETEDQAAAGFYRFLPEVPGDLAEGGRLQMLKVADAWNYDTRTGQRSGRVLYVEWVDIEEADPAGAEEDPLAVFNQGWALGAAVFGRLEGCFYGDGAVYIASASGGDEGEGQLWEYRPRGREGGTLKLVFESPDAELLSAPDDVTVSPGGSLILCESAAMRGLTREGEVFPLVGHEGAAEWRGATFSPDGKVLFANLQGATRGEPGDPALEPGRTIAIWGPWGKGVL
ncbi:PhoX family protein [Glycomyces sp. A-F 0318]|uniref:alkaline phosphatase PhoX n=1 Tax=Glycomyces amatae TaxID=2881355 RepID=UPI001E647AFB|nr:alkaline phosphatase PhoX [Glycomyces amatae]MCD0446029.1 PhoX family protein [Glycomyces amatae]